MAEQKKRGLALSGGGFRATLFHLGVIRYLYDLERVAPETRALSGITHITAVSGGSIIAAHLVLNWELYTGSEEDFEKASQQLIKFIKRDVRGRIIRRIPLLLPFYFASVFLRRTPLIDENATNRWVSFTTTDLLQRQYSKYLFSKRKLLDLDLVPDDEHETANSVKRPTLYLLTTTLDPPSLASFTSQGFHGVTPEGTAKSYDGSTHDLGMAVAASSAFPGMFTSMAFRPKTDRPGFKLVDGGVFDNLGVRKFWELIDKDKEEISEVIVSDASVKVKPADRRTYLELLTTPLRAADILFKRVYEFEKEFAEQADKETKKCSFLFIRLRDKLPNSDKVALLRDYQQELQFTRTDLDKFNDLEIAALVRHGYSIARSKLAQHIGGGATTPTNNIWNPVRNSPKKLVGEMLSRKADRSDAIVSALRSSATRKYRFFSLRDWATPVTVLIISSLIVAYFLLPLLQGLSSSRQREEAAKITDQKLIDLRVSALRDELKKVIIERKVSEGELRGFATKPENLRPDRARSEPLETWATSQAAYALLVGGDLKRDDVVFIAEALDSRFLPPTRDRKGDWDPEIGGWHVRPDEVLFQADPALWTLAALCKLLQRPDLEPATRVKLEGRVGQITEYLSNNNFMDQYNGELDFHLLANRTDGRFHSAYTTSLALMALVEMQRLKKVSWRGPNPQSPAVMISEALIWLDRKYDEAKDPPGWTSVEGDLDTDPPDEAVNLQILAVTLEAYRELGREIPNSVKDRVNRHIELLEAGDPADSRAQVRLVFNGQNGSVRNSEARITFLWRPWAIRLCRTWLASLPTTATTEEKLRPLKLLDRLTKELSDSSGDGLDSSAFTFRIAETMIGIS